MAVLTEQVGKKRIENWIQSVSSDCRYGLRQLRRYPVVSAISIFTLALGIGANTAIFSLINAVALRYLPLPNPQEVVLLRWVAHRPPDTMGGYSWGGCPRKSDDPARHLLEGCSFSYPMYEQIHSRQRVFSGMSAFVGSQELHMISNGQLSSVRGDFVGGDFFSTLGLRAQLGRMLDPSDDATGAEPVAVLRHSYWRRRFGGSPAVIGKRISLEGRIVTIIGVAVPGFNGLDPGLPDDVWLQLGSQPILLPGRFRWDNPANTWVQMLARLKRGVSKVQAEAAISAIFSPSVTSKPSAIFKPESVPRVELPGLAHGLVSLRHEFSNPLYVLMAAAGIILIIACVNIVGLMVARAASREREIAVRRALGASGRRILRQLVIENLMVAAAGAALGIVLAYWGARSLAAFLSANWYEPLQIDVYPDLRILGFASAITILAGVFFGVMSVPGGSHLDLTYTLKGAADSLSMGWRATGQRVRLDGWLVVGQVALSVVVLVGAGLLVCTLVNLRTLDTGFDTRNVLIVSIDPNTREWTAPRLQRLNRELQSRLAAIPGVSSVSYSMVPLLSGINMNTEFQSLDAPEKTEILSDELPVGVNFFETMHIPLLEGRTFQTLDFSVETKPRPIIVNRTLSRVLFGKKDPIGQHFADSGSESVDYEVIGVVGDAKYKDLRRDFRPTAYVPLKLGAASFELRAAGDPKALIPAVRGVVSEVDKSVLITQIRTQVEQIDKTLYRERLVAALSGLFGVLALLLACIGLYGLLAYKVTRGTREIGVRMALGAQQGQILRMVLQKGFVLLATGICVGMIASYGLTRFLASQIWGVSATDPWTFGAVAALVVGVGLAACYLPARRAIQVDPLVALRYE
ncbi:MAG: ABC transporter permease [Candidatus Acidiferrum sp.]